MEENGTSLSCGVRALSWGWEKWLSLVTPVFQAVVETAEECRSAPQHLPSRMQFMLANDGWRGGDVKKCHKDTSVSEADVLESFQRGMEGKI